MHRLSRCRNPQSFKGRTRHIVVLFLRPIQGVRQGASYLEQVPSNPGRQDIGQIFPVFALHLNRLPAFGRDQTQAQRADAMVCSVRLSQNPGPGPE